MHSPINEKIATGLGEVGAFLLIALADVSLLAKIITGLIIFGLIVWSKVLDIKGKKLDLENKKIDKKIKLKELARQDD